MLYFFSWLVVTIWHATFYIKFKYLLFLTHWGFLVWNVYLITAAVTSIISLRQEPWSMKMSSAQDLMPSRTCFGSVCSSDAVNTGKPKDPPTLPWYYKLQWMSFLIGTEYAVAITILYWSMFYEPNSQQNYFSLDSLNLHLLNGIAALVDIWLSGMPVSFYHAIYSIFFGFIYILFTVVYYVADGTDPDGNRFIYQVLDYGTHPVASTGLAVLLTVIVIGIIHYFIFIQHVFRHKLSQKLSCRLNLPSQSDII